MNKVRIRDVVKATADVCEVPYSVLVGPRRHVQTVRARHIAMLMARRLTDASLPQIGNVLGGRDHTTILHGLERARAAITPEQEQAIKKRLQEIIERRPPSAMVKDERFVEARCERYCHEKSYGTVRLATGERAYIPRLACVTNHMQPPLPGDRLFVEVRPGKWGLEVKQASPYRVPNEGGTA